MNIIGYFAAGGGILFLLYLLAVKPAGARRTAKVKKEVRYYAHRGLYDNQGDAPENSMRAFERAASEGYGIELDVRLTQDGIPVVFHDSDLKRMCGEHVRIEDSSWEELQAFRLLGTDQGIPCLEQVLELLDGRVPLLIEYKIERADASVCMCADRLLNQYTGAYCIESFHPFVLLWYRQNRPDILRGILSTDYSRSPKHTQAVWHFISRHLLFNFFTKPDFIAYDCQVRKEISRTLCQKLYGCCMAAWTVRGREQLDEMKDTYDWFIFEGFCPRKE